MNDEKYWEQKQNELLANIETAKAALFKARGKTSAKISQKIGKTTATD